MKLEPNLFLPQCMKLISNNLLADQILITDVL